MTLPAGWLPNPRPAEATTSYTGSTVPTWVAGLGKGKGVQPKGPNNPAGDTPGVPVMSITGAVAAVLEGPQRS